jgi:hypothetical protein
MMACAPAYPQAMRAIRRGVPTVILSALVMAAPAAAKNYAPPGRAGTSQYAEDIPSSGGDVQTPAMGGGNPTPAQISKIGQGRAGLRRLTQLGQAGSAAAQFAQQTAPTVAHATFPRRPPAAAGHHRGHGGSRAGAGTTGETLTPASGGSALSGVGHVLEGSDQGGIGAFLPALLILCAVAAGVLAALRVRGEPAQRPEA